MEFGKKFYLFQTTKSNRERNKIIFQTKNYVAMLRMRTRNKREIIYRDRVGTLFTWNIYISQIRINRPVRCNKYQLDFRKLITQIEGYQMEQYAYAFS